MKNFKIAYVAHVERDAKAARLMLQGFPIYFTAIFLLLEGIGIGTPSTTKQSLHK